MMALDAALALCRLGFYVSAMGLFGATLFLACLAPKTLSHVIEVRSRGLVNGAVVMIIAATAMWMPLQLAEIGGGWTQAFDPKIARLLILRTSMGEAWLIRLLLCAALLGVWRGWFKSTVGMMLVSGALLMSLALTGHAAMNEGGLGLVHMAAHMLHLLAASAWIGGLPVLLFALHFLFDPDLKRESRAALQRFSLMGHGAVALVLATGILNTVLILRRWPTDLSTPYTALLDVKIGLVLLMVAIAITNRYVLVPRFKTGVPGTDRAIARLTISEIVLGIFVLALVAIFGSLDPTRY